MAGNNNKGGKNPRENHYLQMDFSYLKVTDNTKELLSDEEFEKLVRRRKRNGFSTKKR